MSSLATEARRSGTDPFADLSRNFLDAVADGRLAADDLAGEPVDPREIGRYYGRLAAGEAGAAHLDWERLPRAMRVRRRRRASLPPARREVEPYAVADPSVARFDGSPMRFAVIGCGDIGYLNARAIAAATGAEVSICHDANPALAEAVAASFGGSVATDLEQALDPERADAVFLSVPHDLHTPLVARAAEAGLSVVVEKPLAHDLAAAEEAVAAAERAGIAFSVCFAFRYHRTVQAARELVRFGALGDLRGSSVLFHADKPPSYWLGGFSGRAASGWRASRARAGGGVLVMNLAHYIDLIRFIAGIEAISVTGFERTDPGAEVEDAIALGVTWDGGAIGSFSASASTRGAPPTRFELWGERGTVRLEPESAGLHGRRARRGRDRRLGAAGARRRRQHAPGVRRAVCRGGPRRAGARHHRRRRTRRPGLHRRGVPLDRRRRAGADRPPGVSGLTGAAE